MSRRPRDPWRRRLKAVKFLLWKQHMLAVIGQKHAFAANEQTATIPLWYGSALPQLRLIFALVPGELHRREFPPSAILVGCAHRSRRDLRVWRRAAGLHRERCLKFQSPKRQVIPMTSEIAHRAISKIPPPVPFRAGEID